MAVRGIAFILTALLLGVGLDTSFVVGLLGLALGYAISEGDIFGRSTWWRPVRQYGPRALAIAATAAVLCDTRLMMNLAKTVADSATRPQWKPESFFRRFAQ